MRKEVWGGIWIRLLSKLVISLNKSVSVLWFIPQWGGGRWGRGTQRTFPECTLWARCGAGCLTCDVTDQEWWDSQCEEEAHWLGSWLSHLLPWLWAGYLPFLATDTPWAFIPTRQVARVCFVCSFIYDLHGILIIRDCYCYFDDIEVKRSKKRENVKIKSICFYSNSAGGPIPVGPLISWASLGGLLNLSWALYSMLWTVLGA